MLAVTNEPAHPARRATSPLHVPTVVATARELVSPGPVVTAEQAREVVRDLREAAATSVDLVLKIINLDREAEDTVRTRLATHDIKVVDRLGWITANAHTFAEHAADFMPAPKAGLLGGNAVVRAGSVQLGTVLSVVAGRVLGQFDPLGSHRRLLLVAPNVIDIERKLDVNPRDFRLWVTLHETTHRVQFAQAPWIREYLRERIDTVLGKDAAPTNPNRTPTGINLLRVFETGSMLDIFTSPVQRQAISDITAVMSVLEGHADVVMDAVGPSVIPTVATIRAAFERKRADTSGPRGALARLLGIHDKLEQYRTGARFVNAVVRARGHTGLHPLWLAPANLPTEAELHHPDQWLSRVPA